MLRRLTSMAVVVAMASSVAFSQASKAARQSKPDQNVQILDESRQSAAGSFYTDYMNRKLNKTALTPAQGDTVLFTDYDYPGNTQVRQMIDPYDFDGDGVLNPVAVATSRRPGSYQVTDFIYGDPTGYATTPAFDTVAVKNNFSSGMVITPKAGPLKGKALVLARNSTQLKAAFTVVDLATFAPSAAVLFGGTSPSMTYANDGTLWANTNGDQKVYKSTDQGQTWTAVYDIKTSTLYSGFPNELGIESSSDGKYISMIGGFALRGNGSSTVPQDSADFIGWLHSEDAGATWKMDKIAYDGFYNQITNRPNSVGWFQNFGQINVTVDDKGVTHSVMNGYGFYDIYRTADTLSYYQYPITYFNSATKKLYAISNIKADQDSMYNPDYRGGNAMGICYPTITTSADGKVLFCAYQQPEYKGAEGESELNLYPGDQTTLGGPVYYFDIMGTYSLDGGSTWSTPVKLAGKQSVAECYPNVARKLEIKDGKANVYMVYFEDKLPGQSVFSTTSALYNSRAAGAWIYKTYSFSVPTGIEDNKTVINKFELEQNYPNPFNPSTQISYSLDRSVQVTLKVFNVLGKEVATLVNNKTEAAGKHTINFDGSNLTSGMYIYTISAGNQVISKKMMLVK